MSTLFARYFLEVAVLMGVSQGVEYLYLNKYTVLTKENSEAAETRTKKLKHIRNIIRPTTVHQTDDIALQQEIAIEEFLENLGGGDYFLCKSLNENNEKLGNCSHKKCDAHSGTLAHIISSLAPHDRQFTKLSDSNTNDVFNEINWGLVSPKEYSKDLFIKLALQLGLSFGSVHVLNKIYGHIPTFPGVKVFSTIGVSGKNSVVSTVFNNITSQSWRKPNFLRRGFLFGVTSIVGYWVMNSCVELLFEENQFTKKMLGLKYGVLNIGGEKSMGGGANRAMIPFVLENGENVVVSIPGNESLVHLPNAWPGATERDPFHPCRIGWMVALPVMQEGILYSALFYNRLYGICGSRLAAYISTAVCYALSSWKCTDFQAAGLGFNNITLFDNDWDFPDSEDPVNMYLTAIEDIDHADRMIYNFVRSLVLQASFIATGNICAPIAISIYSNFNMLFDEFVGRNDFVQEDSWLWNAAIWGAGLTGMWFETFHGILNDLRKRGIINSHINVLQNSEPVSGVTKLCKSGMFNFNNRAAIIRSRCLDGSTCVGTSAKIEHDTMKNVNVDIVGDDYVVHDRNVFVDFEYAFAMATWYFHNPHSSMPGAVWQEQIYDPSDSNMTKSKYSAPLWLKLAENKKKYNLVEEENAEIDDESKDERTKIWSFADVWDVMEAMQRSAISGEGVGMAEMKRVVDEVNWDNGEDQKSGFGTLLDLLAFQSNQLLTKLQFPNNIEGKSVIRLSHFSNAVVDNLSGIGNDILDNINYEKIERCICYWERYASEEDVLNLIEETNQTMKRCMEKAAAEFGGRNHQNENSYKICISRDPKISFSEYYFTSLDRWIASYRQRELISTLRPYGLTCTRYQEIVAAYGAIYPEVYNLSQTWDAYFNGMEWKKHIRDMALSQ